MKKHSAMISLALAIVFVVVTGSLVGCDDEERYSLSVSGSELLYEDLQDSYAAGEEVQVKVKITPDVSTVAYLDLTPLVKTKSSQNDYYTFTFTMPNKSAVVWIENKKGFVEDLLTGFHLTFSRDGVPIENLNHELKSPDAVADYLYSYMDEELGVPVVTSNCGADVFADGKESVKNVFEEIELEDTLYFTYELLGAVAVVNWVYVNDETNEIRSDGSVGNHLDDIDGAIFSTQALSDTRYSVRGEEYEKTYRSKVKINFKYLDYLTGVKILEYDKNNQLIKASDFVGSERLETFFVGADCEYAVIEEEYTVMNDEARKGEKHYERTLINQSKYGDGITLKYPRGDGLIAPIYLSVKW